MIKYSVMDREPTDDERIHIGIPPFEKMFKVFGLHAKAVDNSLVRRSLDGKKFLVAFDDRRGIPYFLRESPILNRSAAMRIAKGEEFSDPMISDNLLSAFDKLVSGDMELMDDPEVFKFLKSNAEEIIDMVGMELVWDRVNRILDEKIKETKRDVSKELNDKNAVSTKYAVLSAKHKMEEIHDREKKKQSVNFFIVGIFVGFLLGAGIVYACLEALKT